MENLIMISIQSDVSLAVSRAIAAAELRRAEMLQRMDRPRADALLAQQADEASRSPLAYDQLLALALRAAATSEEPDFSNLDPLRAPPDPTQRNLVARGVFGAASASPMNVAVKATPDWELRRASRRVGKEPERLAAWLRSAASLARNLWDHPALPVDNSVRRAMLATATALRRRADALAPKPALPSAHLWPKASVEEAYS